MKAPIIVIVVALAAYTLANFLNGRVETLTIPPMQAALFAAVGGYCSLMIAGMGGRS